MIRPLFLLLAASVALGACSKSAEPSVVEAAPVETLETEGGPGAPAELQSGRRHEGSAPYEGTSYYKYVAKKGPRLRLEVFYVGNLDIFFYPDGRFEEHEHQWGGMKSVGESGDEVRRWDKLKPGETIYFTVVNNKEAPEIDGRPTGRYTLLLEEP